MADILDQPDIDADLTVDNTETDEKPVSKNAVGSSDEQQEIRAYDFTRSEHVDKDRVRTLETVHEEFARNLGRSLSGFLRTVVELRVAGIEQLTYSEFIQSLPNPTCLNLLKAIPLEGRLCLDISPLIVYPIIDRLLGGSNTELFLPARSLTAIEWRLISRITDKLADDLTEVWSRLVDVRFELAETTPNPHLVQIVASDEAIIVIAFELRIGERTGSMTLCYPLKVVEPLLSKLGEQTRQDCQGQGSIIKQSEEIADHLKSADVGIRVFLAQTAVTVDDLMQLKPGDIIQTSKHRDADLLLQIEGCNKFAGKLYQYKGSRALRI
ncbi:MAG: flagellar motor switch protein FliM, partial [Planctomycetota bacterium]